jgi:hypothetical protein
MAMQQQIQQLALYQLAANAANAQMQQNAAVQAVVQVLFFEKSIV